MAVTTVAIVVTAMMIYTSLIGLAAAAAAPPAPFSKAECLGRDKRWLASRQTTRPVRHRGEAGARFGRGQALSPHAPTIILCARWRTDDGGGWSIISTDAGTEHRNTARRPHQAHNAGGEPLEILVVSAPKSDGDRIEAPLP